MIQRFITSLVGVSLLTVTIGFISPLWYDIPAVFVVIITGFVLNYELMSLVKDKKDLYYPFFLIGIFTTISIVISYLFSMKILDFSVFIMVHGILFLIFFYYSLTCELFKAHDFSTNFENIGFYLIVYITMILIFPQFIVVTFIQPYAWALLLLFIFCWISDAFGLFIGSAFGKHPLKMLPSKSKTIEGYIGSIVFTVLLGILFYYFQGVLRLPFQWSLPKWAFFGFIMSISANFGDLTESLIKRWANKKDSGSLLPGLGGIFDAIDSPLYSIPIALLFFYNS